MRVSGAVTPQPLILRLGGIAEIDMWIERNNSTSPESPGDVLLGVVKCVDLM